VSLHCDIVTVRMLTNCCVWNYLPVETVKIRSISNKGGQISVV